VAVVVFVLFGRLGGGGPRGITLVVQAVVCLSGGCSGWPIRRRDTWTLYAPPMPARARLR
jgi:hypothetical protein